MDHQALQTKIRMAKNCIFIKELFNVVDLPGKSSVGISSSHHQSSLSCWRKDTSKGFSPSLSNDGEKWKWASSLFLAKTLFSLNLKESVPRGRQSYKDQVLLLVKSNGSKCEDTQWRKVKQMQPMRLCIFSGMKFEDTHAIKKSRKIPVFYFQKSLYRYLSSIPVYRYFPVYRRGLPPTLPS